jgi:hypothetical protein
MPRPLVALPWGSGRPTRTRSPAEGEVASEIHDRRGLPDAAFLVGAGDRRPTQAPARRCFTMLAILPFAALVTLGFELGQPSMNAHAHISRLSALPTAGIRIACVDGFTWKHALGTVRDACTCRECGARLGDRSVSRETGTSAIRRRSAGRCPMVPARVARRSLPGRPPMGYLPRGCCRSTVTSRTLRADVISGHTAEDRLAT